MINMIITISRDDLEEKDKKVQEKGGQAKITSGLIVEGDQVDGTADNHLEQLQTCDHHRKPCRHLDPAKHHQKHQMKQLQGIQKRTSPRCVYLMALRA